MGVSKESISKFLIVNGYMHFITARECSEKRFSIKKKRFVSIDVDKGVVHNEFDSSWVKL